MQTLARKAEGLVVDFLIVAARIEQVRDRHGLSLNLSGLLAGRRFGPVRQRGRLFRRFVVNDGEKLDGHLKQAFGTVRHAAFEAQGIADL